MKDEDLDSYIAKFKTTLKKAGYKEDDKGALKSFKKGLPSGLNIRIVNYTTPLPTNLEGWINATRTQQLTWL